MNSVSSLDIGYMWTGLYFCTWQVSKISSQKPKYKDSDTRFWADRASVANSFFFIIFSSSLFWKIHLMLSYNVTWAKISRNVFLEEWNWVFSSSSSFPNISSLHSSLYFSHGSRSNKRTYPFESRIETQSVSENSVISELSWWTFRNLSLVEMIIFSMGIHNLNL